MGAENEAYDVLVLGGGSAGTRAASTAREHVERVGLVNDGELGGLCILRGCMPSKAMLASSHALQHLHELPDLGIRYEGVAQPDFAAIMKRRGRMVERFQRAKIRSIESSRYELIRGRGRFVAGGKVEVEGPDGSRRVLSSRAVVIATGSRPYVLSIDGIDDVPVRTSDEVMELTEQPRSIVSVGAGAVGLELSQFFAEIGTRVTLVNRSPLLKTLAPEFGEELAAALLDIPSFELAVPGTITSVEPNADGLVAEIQRGGRVLKRRADFLLAATGRVPAIEDLGLEHTDVVVEGRRIRHGPGMGTDDPRIWVAGDASGRRQILHLANREGEVAGRNAALGRVDETIDERLHKEVIFTDPPVALLGRSQAECEEEGIPHVVATEYFSATGRAITMGVRHGLWRVVAHVETGEILGTQILGPRADDLVHVLTTVMHFRGTVDDLLTIPWYHPTLSEVLIGLARRLKRKRDDIGS